MARLNFDTTGSATWCGRPCPCGDLPGSRMFLGDAPSRLLSRVGGEIVARELDRPHIDRRWAAFGAAAQRNEAVGNRDGDLSGTELIDRLVDIGKQGGDTPRRWYQRLNRIADKGQRATGER